MTLPLAIRSVTTSLSQLDSKRNVVTDLIAKGKVILQNPDKPKFLEANVKRIQDGWEDTKNKATDRLTLLTETKNAFIGYAEDSETVAREFDGAEEEITWKICTPRCTPPFGRTHRLFQKPTGTRAKSPNSKTRRSSPQRKGGIMFSTRSSADAKKQNPRSKETQLSTRFPIFSFTATSQSLHLVFFRGVSPALTFSFAITQTSSTTHTQIHLSRFSLGD